MHCHACGSLIPDDVKFCTVCGASFTDDPAEEEKAPVEAPAVELIEDSPSADPFTEEMNAEEAPNDDDAFFAEDGPEAEPKEDDGSLDPTSPDFDPRKFAGLDLEAFRPLGSSMEEPEEADDVPAQPGEKPRKAKKGRGGIVALVIALVLVLLAAAAGLLYWLTMPVKELVAEDNFAQFMKLDMDQTITDFVVEARETSRLHRQDTLWCAVTIEDSSVHVECDYVMNYRLTTEGWQLAAVDELNTENWVLKPLVGASAEEVAAALIGQQIEMTDTYSYTLTQTDVLSAEILGQTTDLEAGTDVVEATISVVDELVGWTADVELEMIFRNDWQLAAMSHEEPQIEFKPGMEFELTEEDFLAVLAANPIPFAQPEDDVSATVVADGETKEAEASAAQMIKIAKDKVSNLTVADTEFDLEENTQTVMMEFDLDKQVAKLHVEAAISYVFDDGWKVDTITYAPTVEEIILDGEWKGTYTESEGRTPSVTLTIAENEDGTDNNVFAFGPSEANPYFFTGKYYVSDEADPETLAVNLKATDWVLYYNPGGVTMVGLEGGFLMLDDAKITDGKTFTITLQRTVIETETEEAPDETLIARVVETSAPFITASDAPAEEETTEEETAEPETEEAAAPEAEAPAAPAETTTPAEPAQPAETTETTEPTETPEPTEPAEPTQPAKPDDSSDTDILSENDTPIL